MEKLINKFIILKLTPQSKINIIRKICSGAFILGILLSVKLWHSNRHFPLIPLFDFIPLFSPIINFGLLFILLGSLLAIFFYSHKRYIILSLCILSFILIQDQMRWQPWVYIYSLLLISFIFNEKSKTFLKKINYWQIILIGLYVWNGIHKFNTNFIDLIYKSILIDLFKIENQFITTTILHLGYLIPIIEICIGIGLFFTKTRKSSVIIAIISHLFILLYLSPLGINHNSVIYPWNIAMILLVTLIFWKENNKIILFNESILYYKILNYTAILLIWIFPILNFANKWDDYASFSLYSGKTSNFYVVIKESEIEKMNTSVYQYYYRNINGMSEGKIIDIGDWSFRELNVPCYPEKRILKKISRQFCNQNIDSENILFIDSELPFWDRILYKKTESLQTKFHFLKFEDPLNIPRYTYFTCENK